MRRLVTTASLLLLFSSSLLAAPIYKWIDAKGVTHFGSEPPAQQPSESINTKTFQPKPSEKPATQSAIEDINTSAKTQAEVEREVRKQVAEETAALKKYCTDVRYNLAQLENNPRVLTEEIGRASCRERV